MQPVSAMLGIAFNPRRPNRVYCATSGGEVFASQDSGNTWKARPLPEGATQIYTLACG